MSKILLLGSQHGNEILGDRLYKYILRMQPEVAQHVTFIRGNLRAYRQNKRFIESDLNRSYTGTKTTYEQRRASRVLRYIKQSGFDLVLDLHTTTCDQVPCIIITEITDTNRRYLRATSIDKIIKMNRLIAAPSLIGVCTVAISIEIYENSLDTTLMSRLVDDLLRYINGESSKKMKTIFEVNDHIKKGELSDKKISGLKNFEYSDLGFYPILVGEEAYKNNSEFLGFKARLVSRNRL